MITIEEFIEQAKLAQIKHPELRWGQVLYNQLATSRPDLAYRLMGTDADPFHEDWRTRIFFKWLAENWD